MILSVADRRGETGGPQAVYGVRLKLGYNQHMEHPPPRPRGVTLLALADAVISGLATVLRVLQAGPQEAGSGALPTAGLGTMIVFAALGAFAGDDRARSALLYLLILYYSSQAFTQVVLLVTTPQPAVQLRTAAKIPGMALWVTLNAWCFLRPATVACYRRPLSHPKP